MKYKVSVVIPVYNGEAYIEKLCENLKRQSLKEIEIIFVNDGSTDRSKEIINTCAEKYSDIVAIHKNNQGVSVARNVGLEIAKGEYIGFVDVDDSIDIDMYESLYNVAVDKDLDIVSMDQIGEQGKLTIIDDKKKMISMFCEFQIEMSACFKLFRKSLYPAFIFPEGKRINEDAMAVFHGLMCSNRIGCINIQKYYYNRHNGSSSKTKFFSEKYFDAIDLADQIYREIITTYPELEELAEIRRARTYLRISKLYWMRGSPKQFRARIDFIRLYLKSITFSKAGTYFKGNDIIRFYLYSKFLPLFYFLVNTIDRR